MTRSRSHASTGTFGFPDAGPSCDNPPAMTKLNVFSTENLGRIDVGQALASKETSMYIYDVEPGTSSCPYHYEYEEEWLLVLDGTLVVRVPDGERTLERGDLVRFPRSEE